MKNIGLLAIIVSLLVTPISAIEKKNCSGIKKISKAYVACKSGNLKAGIVNTGSKIKKGTVSKIKKEKKVKKKSNFIITPTTKIKKKKKIEEKKGNKTIKNDKKKNAVSTADFKNKFNNLFKGLTKQYPRGIK